MTYFWETSGSIPKGQGFSLFSPTHLFWITVFLIAANIVPYTYRKCSEKARIKPHTKRANAAKA